ncbi:histidine kinase [Microvirga sp. KLBC 81]|uniref:trifunctional serine/threonine-protein kinase/ATP-binding protein/sensor histidine kinase n=1 Tax=Microvirga sp. KLBC 81 TaxID=1862707 RepID=UPI000D508FAF|nr:AAA family ATPase [Microvirga sp. KLBC 81]PVE20724.1 histidine kinase [Microvirga sp. KLBC 81]
MSFRFSAEEESSFQFLWEDGERSFYRGWRLDDDGQRKAVLAVWPAAEHPAPASLHRFVHEYSLRDELDSAWAVRPLELGREGGRTVLVLEDPSGEPLDRLLGIPMGVRRFLRLAIGIATALGRVHQRGLIHKDLKPANILVIGAEGQVRLTGFGLASRLQRERQALAPPEEIAGTLAYMAPEQTGRMNRSIDSRSDLYALGVTLYQMLTGVLPFTATDPMEWVHCHIARQPIPPAERRKDVPAAISAIVMKLLAKTAEERYQTVHGLERDLRRCLAEWKAQRRIDAFPLGAHDTPDRLLIPEKLYGREREIATLVAAFDRVVTSGTPELVLVSGYSGIGKSSVVHELHKVLVPPRGLFAFGKFDQFKRDIPYSTLAQAFRGLIRSLLAKSDGELAPWRYALLEALGPNGQLMVDLVPELSLITGEQPPVPELPPQQSQSRFLLVFRRFLSVFAQPEHPLALFLDDLQWLDSGTLDVLEDWLTQPDVQHLLLIGAYRDNEIDAAHPLRRKLESVRKAGASVQEIMLAPLRLGDVGRLIAEALHSEWDDAEPLAQLVHKKTAGNPFFTIQFLTALADEGLLAFDHGQMRWSWDLEQIKAKGFTDNVVDLMLGKLTRLPEATQTALRQLACLGNDAAIATLNMVNGTSKAALDAALWEAVRAGLVFQRKGTYRFLHDRVQEAAYALIPEGERPAEHLRIGRRLVARTPPEAIEERVFEIVSQLNRGAPLITAAGERERLAELNLLAGRRARASTAYVSALTYLIAGQALLPEDAWERRPELAFALELHRAECEFLTGLLMEAEARLADLASRTTSLPDQATVTRLRVDLFMTLGRSDSAVAVGLDYLGCVGIAWSAHPTREEVQQEYARIWRQLGDRPIETLLDLPRLTDPVACGTMEVLTALVTPALFTDENLRCLVIGRMGNISLEHGNSDASCYAYTAIGTVLGPYFGDYKAGLRFGQLGLDLVEQPGMDRLKARVYLAFGNLASSSIWHPRTARPPARHAFDAAQKAGDLTYAAFSCNGLITQLLASGDRLTEVQREAEYGLDFARQARFGLVVDLITAQLQLIRTLRGLTPAFGRFDDVQCDEERFERHLETDSRLAIAACLYWIRKLQARVLADDYVGAVAAAAKAERLLWMSPSIFERAEYHFYAALMLASLCGAASAAESDQDRQALAGHHRQLQEWAENCPESFESRAALIGAEIARIEGRDVDAMRLYEQAIRSARASGFVHNEAIANERASAFYRARGFDQIAALYLRNARHCYLCWGADGKVRQLDDIYPHLREGEPVPSPTRTIGAPVEYIDVSTVISVSQAVSGEIVLDKLLETLMRTALAQAGAERGLLILPRGAEPRIAAEAVTCGDTVVVHLRDEPVAPAALPESVFHYVLRTRENVVLDDASAPNPFVTDPYIPRHHARSVLCLPLLNQAKLIGVLYLENNLAPRVFAPARMAVLKLLASQAAISLENSRLYRDLTEREARIRRLVEANIIGIFLWNFDGRIIEANDAFLRIVGYAREELVAGRLRWTDLTPPEYQPADQGAAEEIRQTGSCRPYEKEFLRKDGSRVPVLLGWTTFEESRTQGVAFVLDLTEHKRMEAEARESERRLRETQMELAHANRVTTMGQLAASIAHEVNQPIAAAVISAQAGLRWLAREPPDMAEVRQSLSRIVESAERAGEVIGRIKALVKKAPALKGRLDVNEAVQDVVSLTRSEALKHGVSLQTDLAPDLPSVAGDRVQLQQVVLNLIMNAIEAMSGLNAQPREVLVRTEMVASGGVVVAVRDSGPGLETEGLERVFAPFYTTKSSGMGMGLAICRSIIEAHGGRLWAEANEPRGAVFQFTLPSEGQDHPQ